MKYCSPMYSHLYLFDAASLIYKSVEGDGRFLVHFSLWRGQGGY